VIVCGYGGGGGGGSGCGGRDGGDGGGGRGRDGGCGGGGVGIVIGFGYGGGRDGGDGGDDDDAVRLSRIPPQCGFCQATHWPAQYFRNFHSDVRLFLLLPDINHFFQTKGGWMASQVIYIYMHVCVCVCVLVHVFGLLYRSGP